MLIEVIALAFLVVVAAAMVVPFKLLARSAENDRAALAADYLAQAEISYLMANDSAAGSYDWLGTNSWLEQNGVKYDVSATVAAADYGTRRAVVTVSWTDRGGKKRTRSLARNL